MLHRALIPEPSIAPVWLAAHGLLYITQPRAHHACHRSPGHGTQGSIPSLPLASQRSLGNIKDLNISQWLYPKATFADLSSFFSLIFSFTSPASEEGWTEPCFPVIPDNPSTFMSSTKTESTLKIK